MLNFQLNTAVYYRSVGAKITPAIDTAIDNAYNLFSDDNFSPKKLDKANKALKAIHYEGKAYIGKGALKRLKTATTVLFETATAQGRPVNMLTLTLPSDTWKKTGLSVNDPASDKLLKRYLLPATIDYIKQCWGVHLYIYRCESQENGRLHFHFLVDANINKRQIMLFWNTQCNYFLKDVNMSDPSTRIDKIKNAAAGAAYTAKYLTKSPEGRRATGGRQWGCSELLKGVKPFIIDTLTDNGVHTEVLDTLNEMAESYPESCLKLFICVNNVITKEMPSDKNDVVATFYKYDVNLWRQLAPPGYKQLKNNYFKALAVKKYGLISEKPYQYINSKIAQLAFLE